MSMRSTSLLPSLRQLPTQPSGDHRSFRDIITGLASTDRTMYAAEVVSATSFGLWGVFNANNVDDEMYSRLADGGLDDRLAQAYEMAYRSESASRSLQEHWLEMTESGDASVTGFVNGLKGKLAEIESKELLEQNGFTNVEIAVNGNLVGGIVGTAAGAGMGMYLNWHLEPRMLDLALDITGLTNDDLFYYKNKVRIDGTAVSFRQTAIELGASS